MKKPYFVPHVFFVSVLVSSVSAHASRLENYPEEYFELKPARVELLEVVESEVLDFESLPKFKMPGSKLINAKNGFKSGGGGTDGGSGVSIDQIVNYFFKFWDLIERNRPVMTVNSKYANAVPGNIGSEWQLMTGWKTERSFKYRVVYENSFGIEVVDLEYQVKLIYGGRYMNSGYYIASVRAIPIEAKVLVGFTLDVNAEVSNVWNAGTPENPIAAIQLDVTWMVKSVTKLLMKTESYHLQGDGQIINTADMRKVFKRDESLF